MPFVGGLEERTFEHSILMLYARDAKSALQPNETQRNTLIVAAVYILAIGILWYVLSRWCPPMETLTQFIGMSPILKKSVSVIDLQPSTIAEAPCA
jgi:hypothetical protein